MSKRKCVIAGLLILVAFALGRVEAQCAESPDAEKPDMQKLTQESSNPVGELWMIVNQFNFNLMRSDKGKAFKDPKLQFNWDFQPVLTFDLNNDLRLIARPVIPLYDSPYQSGRDQVKDQFGLGDAEFMAMLSPIPAGGSGFMWGVGPTAVFPTATDKHLGNGKWQLGPALAALYMDEKWVVGIFPQHWWSIGGDGSRADVSLTKAEYFLWYSFAPTWQVGMGPNVIIDWTQKKAEDALTLPVGLGFAKLAVLGKLPVKFAVEADYSVIRPRNIPGNEWTFKFSITPIIPNMF